MNDINALLPHLRLQLNIKHPELEDCYVDGYECALAEIGEEENPFAENTPEHEHWQEGWWAGFYGEQPLFADAMEPTDEKRAANDRFFSLSDNSLISNVLRITGAIAASAWIGYQIIDLVA